MHNLYSSHSFIGRSGLVWSLTDYLLVKSANFAVSSIVGLSPTSVCFCRPIVDKGSGRYHCQ